MNPATECPYIFAYGTLKRGCSNHPVIQQAGGKFIAAGETLQCYPLVVGAYPFLLDEPGTGHRIRGDVFRIESAEGWRLLDLLEEHPEVYRRKIIKLSVADRELLSWTYFLVSKHPSLRSLPFISEYNGCIPGDLW